MNHDELAAAIALELPAGWRATSRHDLPYLVREADGAAIVMHCGGWRREGRVEFCGTWPTRADGRTYDGGRRPTITCSDARSPASLANDLRRRLLPLYDPAYTEARSHMLDTERRCQEAVDVATRLSASVADATGEVLTVGDIDRARRGDGVPITAHWAERIERVSVHQAYGSSLGEEYARPVRVDIRLSGLSPEAADAILRIAAEDGAARDVGPSRVADEPAISTSVDEEPSEQDLVGILAVGFEEGCR